MPCALGFEFGVMCYILHYLRIVLQGKQSISLEPGGQIELSGMPLKTLHQTYDEINSHLLQVSVQFSVISM